MAPQKKDEQAKTMYEEYNKGYSLAQVGKMFNITRQAVYELLKSRGYNLRKANILPYQYFDGEKFTIRNNGYYGRTTGDRALMHRIIWQHHNGVIPEGFVIHHKNRDRTDNRIENLEIMSKSEHARKYATGNNQYTKK
jgi:hypothetical protein